MTYLWPVRNHIRQTLNTNPLPYQVNDAGMEGRDSFFTAISATCVELRIVKYIMKQKNSVIKGMKERINVLTLNIEFLTNSNSNPESGWVGLFSECIVYIYSSAALPKIERHMELCLKARFAKDNESEDKGTNVSSDEEQIVDGESRNEPVFLATCTPVAMPETRECVVQGATNVFTSIHSMDMKFMHIDKK
ncbi:hypothetical protein ANN_11351 [Periplaneta americana]|uniref:Uncharacterized protein n=1 Tax=Periplaneta americana TaxID=6978 RepID=A0ABQ8T736_PERAM|nr:hypothetical protein ANN_11351 [Periplaneta americana]